MRHVLAVAVLLIATTARADDPCVQVARGAMLFADPAGALEVGEAQTAVVAVLDDKSTPRPRVRLVKTRVEKGKRVLILADSVRVYVAAAQLRAIACPSVDAIDDKPGSGLAALWPDGSSAGVSFVPPRDGMDTVELPGGDVLRCFEFAFIPGARLNLCTGAAADRGPGPSLRVR